MRSARSSPAAGGPIWRLARLPGVRAPVLLIVGGHDEIVIELNREARSLLRAPSELAIVPGATHLFEEPGALEEVSRLAGEWFERHLTRAATPTNDRDEAVIRQLTCARTPLVRRALTRAGMSAFELVEWSERRCRSQSRTGEWCSPRRCRRGSDQLVEPRGRGGRPALLRPRAGRPAGALGARRSSTAWSGRSPPGRTPPVTPPTLPERDALRDELAALVLTQKATFATPVWLNAGLTERPLTSACFILKAEDSIPELLDWNTRRGADLPAGRRRRDQPLGDPLFQRAGLARRPGERARVVHARHRRLGRNDPRRRTARAAARRWSCSTPHTPTSSSSSTPRRARRTAAGRCSPPGIRSRRWSPRSRSSTPTTPCG